jgi:hypothetical protein
LKIEIELNDAVAKHLERTATRKGLTLSEYVSSNVNGTVIFAMTHREVILEHETSLALTQFLERQREQIKAKRQ